ncbi:hypothetical protein [Promicromonospora iranensis]|uniref:Glyoxalase-like domain-containing protein n=1 Tax=Promicromonospora iranensis TaxID=1105144 RepID=A0ABU2CRA5_9MICO|nr:hypothetical protein [Promicromonospora iranensis]MDR7383878.1 hypothetical protein [Promicromonospora iranensis]
MIDVQDGSLPTLLGFYRQAFATAEGWTSVKTDSEQELCLVNQSDDRYAELLEVFPYSGDRVEARRGRYVVMISRLEPDFGKEPCGEARSWVSTDLLPLHPNVVVR